jgi:hypothetical protein
MHAHLHERPPVASSVRPDLPRAIDRVTTRALEKAPDDRYDSGRALTNDLREVLATPVEPETIVPGAARRRIRPFWAAAAAVATTILVMAAAVAWLGRRPETEPPSTVPVAPRVIRSGVQVVASHTSGSSTDAAGNPVTYVPAHVIDGDVETAWRTAGDGRGETIRLIFDNPVNVVRIGLIPGYAKTDARTGVDRFFQHRIIEEVAYEVPGRSDTRKRFRPAPVPQFVRLHVLTPEITVRILRTTPPGGLDYTAISEIYVYGSES